jgi:hypothetical protein
VKLKDVATKLGYVLTILAALGVVLAFFGPMVVGRYMTPAEVATEEMREIAAEGDSEVRAYHDSSTAEVQGSREARTEIMQRVEQEQQTLAREVSDLKFIALMENCEHDAARMLQRIRMANDSTLLQYCNSIGVRRQLGDTPPAERNQ